MDLFDFTDIGEDYFAVDILPNLEKEKEAYE